MDIALWYVQLTTTGTWPSGQTQTPHLYVLLLTDDIRCVWAIYKPVKLAVYNWLFADRIKWVKDKGNNPELEPIASMS